jgi:hypothetical protein
VLSFQGDSPSDKLDDFADSDAHCNDQTDYHTIFTLLVLTSHLSSADLTGRFPLTSRRGHKYILVAVLNGYIHFELLKSRSSSDLVCAYTAMLTFFAEHQHTVSIVRLDNETSSDLDAFLCSNVEHIQLLPPHSYRANRAERAIRTAKNQIISMLAGADPSFPLYEWDESIAQAEITLNILRPHASNPAISAYHGLHGHQFPFNNHPIAPFGVKDLIHEAPDVRGT